MANHSVGPNPGPQKTPAPIVKCVMPQQGARRLTLAELDAALTRAEHRLGLCDIEDEPPEALAEFEAIGAAMLRFDV